MNPNAPILDWHFNAVAVARYGFQPLLEALGFIPAFVTSADNRPAWEQFDENYISGWNPVVGGFQLNQDDYLIYPGDPPLEPLAFAMLRDERILVYPHAWVCIVQRDGSFSVARMD